ERFRNTTSESRLNGEKFGQVSGVRQRRQPSGSTVGSLNTCVTAGFQVESMSGRLDLNPAWPSTATLPAARPWFGRIDEWHWRMYKSFVSNDLCHGTTRLLHVQQELVTEQDGDHAAR